MFVSALVGWSLLQTTVSHQVQAPKLLRVFLQSLVLVTRLILKKKAGNSVLEMVMQLRELEVPAGCGRERVVTVEDCFS